MYYGYDIATSPYYDDTPGATNYIMLYNFDSSVTIALLDDHDGQYPPGGVVDVGRVYQTQSLSPSMPALNSNSPTSGVVNQSYGPFTATATCTGTNEVQYEFDWGDGTPTTKNPTIDGTMSGYCSGVQSHSWSNPGTYTVRVRANDATFGNYSAAHNWSLIIFGLLFPNWASF